MPGAMKENNVICLLKPQIMMPFEDDNLSLLWFQKSNTYTIIDNNLMDYLQAFLYKTQADFFRHLKINGVPSKESLAYYKALKYWLEQANHTNEDTCEYSKSEYLEFKQQNKEILHSTYYSIYGKWIQINFPNHKIKNLVHPQLSYYEARFNDNITYQVLDIMLFNSDLVLYLNKTFVNTCDLSETHVFLGKLSLQIISLLYSKLENDWLATFHASTIVKQDKAIMCIGKSGSGKSTLCSLLSQFGYDVLADDLTPMLYANQEVYRNPSAISIKKGAFKLLKPYVKDFNALATINNYKGDIRFLPINRKPKYKDSFRCNKIVVVNYNKDIEQASMEIISKSDGLDILITESWVSDQPDYALQFLNWINTVTFYRLTYSKTKDAVACFNML